MDGEVKDMRYCPKCGTEYRDGFEKCGDCNEALVDTPVVPPGNIEKYGSLWKRGVATVVDDLIIRIPFFFLTNAFAGEWIFKMMRGYQPGNSSATTRAWLVVLALNAADMLIGLIYVTIFIGKFGSSLGQKLMKLKVLTDDEVELGYKKAFIRALAFLIYSLPYIGGIFLIISAATVVRSQKHKALHDMLGKTVVLNTP